MSQEDIEQSLQEGGSRDTSKCPDNAIEVEGEVREFDSEDEDEFVRKYGAVNFQYIKRPREAIWFTRPYGLNYFKDGVLYRTKGERTSAKTELFLDLLYVGVIARLAGDASEEASGAALLKYVMLFIPAWTVWSDIKDFTNYYYNGDLSQKLYILWIMSLLTLYVNNTQKVLDTPRGTALVVVPYILIRFSLAVSYFVYSFFVPEHRPQQRLFCCFILLTCCLWIPVIFIGTRAKIGLGWAVLFLENFFYVVAFHPWTKKLMKLSMSTALNIEHIVERFGVFVTIAIGEFLYKVVETSALKHGIDEKFGRAIFLIILAYCLFWIYNYGSNCQKATHALRYSGWTSITWIGTHLFTTGAIVLAADAGGELLSADDAHLTKSVHLEDSSEKRPSLYALSLFYTGGICVSLVSMTVMGFCDHPEDAPCTYIVPRFLRIIWRVPVGVIVLCLSFANISTTLLMGMSTMVLVILVVYETIVSNPNLVRYSQSLSAKKKISTPESNDIANQEENV